MPGSKINLLKKFSITPGSLFLFCVLIFLRLPFFFRDYIDRDESTFIIMGQSIADGYLPYEQLWDLKPPLLFYLFGLIEYIFPHSIVAIRLSGVFVIFGSALLLLKIAKTSGVKNGFLIALSYVLLSSMFGSVQGVMSEHVAVFFMLGGLFFFIKKKTILNLLIAGFLFGCALLCKMNYGYAIPAILLYHFISGRSSDLPVTVKNAICVIAGIIVSFLLMAIPFIINHKLNLFIDSVFLAPYEYSHAAQTTLFQNLKKTWWVFLLGLFVSFFALKRSGQAHKEIVWIFVLALLATIYTYYSIGTVNGHYLIQIYPFISILIVGFIFPKEYNFGFGKLSLFILLISFESITEYYMLFNNYRQHSTLYNGKSLEVIKELKARHDDDKKVFFANYHIGYWFLHQYPLTKSTTHPSTLTRQFLFKYADIQSKSSLEEIKYLMENVKPEIIVSRSMYLDFFDEFSEENTYFKNIIDTNYTMIYQNHDKRIFIWQLKSR
jgi:4-amino-4-deoxy-L-arabinose transferase-like glycosyltransferase